jgi:putative radical SAM enzyme (TIGR03279 family)
MKGLISKVKAHSLAEAAGIKAGEALLKANGSLLHDILDLSFAIATDKVQLELLDAHGKPRTVTILKDPDEDLGLEFEEAVFDGVRRCQNHCVFCFVDQMIPGMRRKLYVKDDDYRLSFLYGNFITLTNMDQNDFDDIIRRHLSPLYVSVHTTSPEVRSKMMRNDSAVEIMNRLHLLLDAGIEIHVQVVCCPGYNDGEVLKRTYSDLRKLVPGIATMAVVPVGLTKNRSALAPLRTFTKEEAQSIVEMANVWQKECRQELGKSFVYLADEFYILAEAPLPPDETYDGFPQLENGIGLSRNFISSWEKEAKLEQESWEHASHAKTTNASKPNYCIPVGESAAKVLAPLLLAFNKKWQTKHRLLSVKNNFFGPSVNVTGLLTATDILENLPAEGNVILPAVVLNNDNLFLDDMTLAYFMHKANREVKIAATGADLYKLLAK